MILEPFALLRSQAVHAVFGNLIQDRVHLGFFEFAELTPWLRHRIWCRGNAEIGSTATFALGGRSSLRLRRCTTATRWQRYPGHPICMVGEPERTQTNQCYDHRCRQEQHGEGVAKYRGTATC